MRVFVSNVITFWATNGENNIDFRTIVNGRVENKPFRFEVNFDCNITNIEPITHDCFNFDQGRTARAIYDALVANAMVPNHLDAYGIYNGDVDEGPEVGAKLDQVNRELELTFTRALDRDAINKAWQGIRDEVRSRR